MADSSSGRDPSTNAGSDSAKHYTGTAHNQYQGTPETPRSKPVTGQHSNGYAGNGKPGKAPDASDVK